MTLPSEEHRGLLIQALNSLQFSGDVKGREAVKHFLQIAEECLVIVQAAEIEPPKPD